MQLSFSLLFYFFKTNLCQYKAVTQSATTHATSPKMDHSTVVCFPYPPPLLHR